MQANDLTLWGEIQKGHVDSLRVLHDRYYFQLCAFANKYLRNLSVSEELVSDSFFRLWDHREHVFIEKSVKGYLYFMVRNQMIDYLRKKKKELVQETENMPDIPDKEMMNNLEFYAELYQAISKLPLQRRRILELAAFDSLTYREIAAKLNISVNTVKTQMARSYQFLKEELDPRNFILYLLVKRRN